METVPDTPTTQQRVSKRTIADALATLDSASRPPATDTKATKKRRTAPAASSTPALEAILAARALPRRATASSAPPPRSYEPNSFESLIERLSTFRLTTFSPSKPRSLSPLDCALHGWVNRGGRDRLECVTCAKGVVLLAPSASGGWTSPAGVSLRLEYERLVASRGLGHDPTCPWKMRPCARSLYKLETRGGRRKLLETVGRHALEMQLRGLGEIQLQLDDQVPRAIRACFDDRIAADKLSRTVSSALQDPSASSSSSDSRRRDAPDLSITTLVLAIFGWSLDPLPSSAQPSLARSSSSSSSLASLKSASSPRAILTCSYCLRQVLASAYLASAPSTSTSTSTSTAATETTTATTRKLFNPVSQHCLYCPFVDTAVAAGASTESPTTTKTTPTQKKKPGYQVRFETIVGQRPRLVEHVRLSSSASNETGPSPSHPREQGQAEPEGEVRGAHARGGTEARSFGAVKTRELLSYVRGLLGPKVSTLTTTPAGKK
ncbi:hypothetical protein JCM3766R1_006806 [Sporobolomyces carnicolor]